MLALSSIRARLATGLASALAAWGWRGSRVPCDEFAGGARHSEQLVEAGGIVRTVPARQDMQRLPVGAMVRTFGGVRWSHRLRADAAQADIDAALDAEAALVAALMGVSRDPELAIRWEGCPVRHTVGEGTLYLGEVAWSVLHRYALS